MSEVNVTHIYRLYTLLLLESDSRHGYEIIDEIEQKTGKKPSTSHIYPFLSELQENGYLVSEKGSRGKKIYTLTEDGEAFVSEQINAFGDMLSVAIQGDIEECHNCRCKIYDGGFEEEGNVYCCRHCADAERG